MAALCLLPFAIQDLLRGYYLLGGTVSLVILLMVSNALIFWRHRRLLMPAPLLLLLVIATTYLAIYREGIHGVYWAYPVVIAFHFLMQPNLAIGLSVVFIVGIIPLAGTQLGWAETLRIVLTLSVSSAFTGIFAAIVLRQQQTLQRLTITDPLTQTFNRRHLHHCLETALAQQARYGITTSLVLFDIDHFKQINDRFGHQMGDLALQRLSQQVRQRLRRTDTIFRFGGEEFVILLPATTLNEARQMAEDLTRQIAQTSILRSPAGDR
ncbi:GGDEF domain-containing protein [Halomicronema hongdechloris C2206]|uniref:GGDEF domain-containing protein n=1 Tax=Halomicronema hongdechloris C2206 TaxID=1641165 RepID=A0A1Z3HFV6_9CYAN|nr:GGDEF domain-containing protein [Halomicronema hongdechloris]ASC69178.1 GGDEF domain-containing protein [Halomicronema hongdechloris C2206]